MIFPRQSLFALPFLILLAACVEQEPRLGPDGQPLPQIYRIPNESEVQFRMLDSINALRQSRNLPPLRFNSNLNAAAKTHSIDMARQNRPWHFGSDGSSPFDRVQRAGYRGQLIGEAISETFETETQTLAAWMQQPDTRELIMSRDARDLGFAWYQEKNGRIWWTLLTGGAQTQPRVAASSSAGEQAVF